VEVCNEIQAVKYLFKYVHKGPDRITINISRNNSNPNSSQHSATPQTNENYQLPRNEVDNYINSRYVGPCEAFWRIFGFQMHEHEPSVTRLGFHLPNQQTILYEPGHEAQASIHAPVTQLTQYFARVRLERENPLTNYERGYNRNGQLNSTALEITYSDFADYYV